MTFQEMKLIAPLLKAVQESGYETPTPIQQATIPLALAGGDILGCAQTGTGKTAAFALPILQKLSESAKTAAYRPIRALILTPTRELAQQITDSFLAYGSRRLSLRVSVIFGGVSQVNQVNNLKRGIDILVATPGRLNDLIGQGLIKLDRVDTLVLDEADRMLDMGFIRDVQKIIALLPRERQTLFFSATMPAEVEKLSMEILRNPAKVKVNPVTRPVESIRQSLYYVDRPNKKFLLAHLLSSPEIENALIFRAHAPRRGQGRAGIDAGGHRIRGDPRRQDAGRAPDRACALQERGSAGHGRDRHRGARHRYHRPFARVQL